MLPDSPAPTATIEVTVAHNPLAIIYKAFKPTITINGTKHRKRWGTYVFDVPPGQCEVAAS